MRTGLTLLFISGHSALSTHMHTQAPRQRMELTLPACLLCVPVRSRRHPDMGQTQCNLLLMLELPLRAHAFFLT